uniref:Plant natriuretic peptide-like 9 n=1 Tax=Venturia pyrina TaxID=415593 RepID=A0A513ZSB7_9PEZI|nr:plant natriuretic peptide-like 9 [Venturia pyrina]
MKAPTALIALSYFAHLGLCAVASATTYKPPYTPNKCFGHNTDVFPSNGFFAAAGPRIWDNGASCGKCFTVRCVAAFGPGQHCIGDPITGNGGFITVKIVEGRLGRRAADFSFSQKAGAAIYTGGGPSGGGSFRIEYNEQDQCF